MKITAKVRCNSRVSGNNGDTVIFGANYVDDDGRRVNEEWAKYTPALSLTMTVHSEVPFKPGQAYTLTFDDGE